MPGPRSLAAPRNGRRRRVPLTLHPFLGSGGAVAVLEATIISDGSVETGSIFGRRSLRLDQISHHREY